MLSAALCCTSGYFTDNKSGFIFAAEESASASDVVKVKEYLLSSSVLSDEEKNEFDVNGDGTINIFDMRTVLSRYLDNPEPTVPVRPTSFKLDVPMVYQNPELPTGCEATSLTILLNYSGFNVSKTTVADLMPKMDFYYSGGVYYGADYITTFPGNPRYDSGYGCYTPCMVTTASRYFSSEGISGCSLSNISGNDFDRLFSYVAAGKPVMVWATMNMIEPRDTVSWTTPEGRYVTWKGNEHCLVITGYDLAQGIVYVNDPLRGKVTYSISTFEHRYNQMGKYAAVIVKNDEEIILPEPGKVDSSASSGTAGTSTTHKVGDTVSYSGPAYYSCYGGSSVYISGSYRITEIISDRDCPYGIRLGVIGWVPYNV